MDYLLQLCVMLFIFMILISLYVLEKVDSILDTCGAVMTTTCGYKSKE